jgi:hypothetical protein
VRVKEIHFWSKEDHEATSDCSPLLTGWNISAVSKTSVRRCQLIMDLISLQVASVAEIFRLQQDHELKEAENCYLLRK